MRHDHWSALRRSEVRTPVLAGALGAMIIWALDAAILGGSARPPEKYYQEHQLLITENTLKTQDITVRKQAEQALERSHAALEQAQALTHQIGRASCRERV